MSIQSEWQPASQDEPAEFELDYVNIKVQAICAPGSDKPAIQVRLATTFDTDWMEHRFDEWCADMGEDTDEVFEALYPMLKVLRGKKRGGGDWALLNSAINELEQRNSGLIRG